MAASVVVLVALSRCRPLSRINMFAALRFLVEVAKKKAAKKTAAPKKAAAKAGKKTAKK